MGWKNKLVVSCLSCVRHGCILSSDYIVLYWYSRSISFPFWSEICREKGKKHGNKSYTVDLRSKGPGSKGNPPLREIISGLISLFSIYFYIGYKGISVYGKNWAGPMKSLGAKFHCSYNITWKRNNLIISSRILKAIRSSIKLLQSQRARRQPPSLKLLTQ